MKWLERALEKAKGAQLSSPPHLVTGLGIYLANYVVREVIAGKLILFSNLTVLQVL